MRRERAVALGDGDRTATGVRHGSGGGWPEDHPLFFLLLLPGVAWLIIFFVVPMVQLFSVSLRSNFPGYPGYYYRDLNFGNYWRVWTEFAPHFGRSLLLASIATFLAFLLAYPLA